MMISFSFSSRSKNTNNFEQQNQKTTRYTYRWTEKNNDRYSNRRKV